MRKIFLHISLFAACGVLCLASALSTTGCENNDISNIDSQSHPPFLTDARITPGSVNIDTLSPVGGNYIIRAGVSVRVSDPDGSNDVEDVHVEIVRPGAENSFLESGLSGRDMYAGNIQFQVSRAESGPYRVDFVARDKSGLYGNVLAATLQVTRKNSPPRLSQLTAPDTLTRPLVGRLIAHIAIVAADSDGIADIQQVYFRSLNSSNPNFKFYLYDDGGSIPLGAPFFLSSGDSVAGDGKYSVLIPFDTTAVRRTNVFAFQATDTFGDTSATVFHYLTVR